MYAVIDTATRNVLGEFEDPAEAEAMYREIIAADERAARFVTLVASDEAEPEGQAVQVAVEEAEQAALFA